MTATFDKSLRRRRHRRPEIRGHPRIDPPVLRCLARLQPAASRRRLHEGQFRQDQFRRHHHARHEQFRADLADDHRLGLSCRRGPPAVGDAVGQAGPARRYHPAHRDHQGQADDRKIPLGFDRRGGEEPGWRRRSRPARPWSNSHATCFASDSQAFCRASIRPGLGPERTEGPENGPIRIDIRCRHGLETAPSRAVGRFRDKSHFATFG